MNNKDSRMFLLSALVVKNAKNKMNDILSWIKTQNDSVKLNIEKVPFSKLDEWKFSNDKKDLHHNTGKFFSISGIEINTNYGSKNHWSQPIINQPEIGYLGFIVKEFDGILYFLTQAKIEPGNINYVQLSPTIQATKSNYTQVHNGRKPKYLEYFQKASPEQILYDQLQSEQGARFLKKRNRNIIIKVDEEIIVHDNFIWLTVGQLKELITHNNLVNMDTRTVLSGVTYGNFSFEELKLSETYSFVFKENNIKTKFLMSSLLSEGGYNSEKKLISWITTKKCEYDLKVDKVSLSLLSNWSIDDFSIKHSDNKYFKVIGVSVTIENREVSSWTQPMIESIQPGLCVFICKEINDIIHFAVQAKLECGNHDIIELAPTVQCLNDNYKSGDNELPFLEYALNVKKEHIFYDSMQSEEGGRFYREENRNMIIISNETDTTLPSGYVWMTLNQLQNFIKYSNYVNIQARNLISAISFC